jgi:hypothetical protein
MRVLIVFAILLPVLLVAPTALGHPLSQGAMTIVVFPDHVDVQVRVTMEEFAVTDLFTAEVPISTPAPMPATWPAGATQPITQPAMLPPVLSTDKITAAYERHARYLAAHVHVTADGTTMTWKVMKITPPIEDQLPALQVLVYDIEYRPASPSPLKDVEVTQNVLTDGRFEPGQSWESSYVTKICQEGQAFTTGLLLTRTNPVGLTCDWSHNAGAAKPPQGDQKNKSGSLLLRGSLIAALILAIAAVVFRRLRRAHV